MTKRAITDIVSLGVVVLTLTSQTFAQTTKPERVVDVRTALSALVALTETQIQDTAGALAVAAVSEEARSGEWERIRPLLAAFEGRFPPAALWFARPDGSYFTLEKGLTDQNLKDRPYFATVMKGQVSIGELVISRSTGSNTTIVAVPIKRADDVVGVLGASIYLDKLSQRLTQAVPLPPLMVFYALDPQGRVALHTQTGLVFQEAQELGSPTLTKAVQTMLSTPEGVVTYSFAGGEQKAIYQTAPALGWRFAIRFPAAEASGEQ